MHARVPDYLPTSPLQTVSEGSFSETHCSKPPHQHTVYSRQSTVTPYFCFLLAGHRHICCKDLLRGATDCCSRVAGELVLCRPLHYTVQSAQDWETGLLFSKLLLDDLAAALFAKRLRTVPSLLFEPPNPTLDAHPAPP